MKINKKESENLQFPYLATLLPPRRGNSVVRPFLKRVEGAVNKLCQEQTIGRKLFVYFPNVTFSS
jgi:hypothetical protein